MATGNHCRIFLNYDSNPKIFLPAVQYYKSLSFRMCQQRSDVPKIGHSCLRKCYDYNSTEWQAAVEQCGLGCTTHGRTHNPSVQPGMKCMTRTFENLTPTTLGSLIITRISTRAEDRSHSFKDLLCCGPQQPLRLQHVSQHRQHHRSRIILLKSTDLHFYHSHLRQLAITSITLIPKNLHDFSNLQHLDQAHHHTTNRPT